MDTEQAERSPNKVAEIDQENSIRFITGTLFIGGIIEYEGGKAAMMLMDDGAIQPKHKGTSKSPADVEEEFEENLAKLKGDPKIAFLRENGSKKGGYNCKFVDLSKGGEFPDRGVVGFGKSRRTQEFIASHFQREMEKEEYEDEKNMARKTQHVLRNLLERSPEDASIAFHAQIEGENVKLYYLNTAKKHSGKERVGTMQPIGRKYAVGIGEEKEPVKNFMNEIFGHFLQTHKKWDRNGLIKKMWKLKTDLQDLDDLLGEFEVFIIRIPSNSNADSFIHLKQSDAFQDAV